MLALLANPLFRWCAGIVGVLALFAALILGVKHVVHKHDQGVRQEVHREYEVRDLKRAVKDAEADRKFAEDQARKSEAEVAELRKDLSAMRNRVGQARTVIRERVASGQLPNGTLSPTITATIDQIETLEGRK